MSRLYGIDIAISKFNKEKIDEIEEAAGEEWSGLNDDWSNPNTLKTPDPEPSLSSYSEGYFCSGEDEEEFINRITKAVWKANGGFCIISISATCLEDLPFNSYELDKDDYDQFVEDEKETQRRGEKNGLYPGKEDTTN